MECKPDKDELLYRMKFENFEGKERSMICTMKEAIDFRDEYGVHVISIISL